jgi:hypothetical protein
MSEPNVTFELPPELLERAKRMKPTCPAATVGRFADTGGAYVRCGVEQEVIALKTSPVGVLTYCCGEFSECSSWQMAKDDPEKIAAIAARKELKAQEALRRRQIESGMRVDDAGVGHERAMDAGEQEMKKQLLDAAHADDVEEGRVKPATQVDLGKGSDGAV